MWSANVGESPSRDHLTAKPEPSRAMVDNARMASRRSRVDGTVEATAHGVDADISRGGGSGMNQNVCQLLECQAEWFL